MSNTTPLTTSPARSRSGLWEGVPAGWGVGGRGHLGRQQGAKVLRAVLRGRGLDPTLLATGGLLTFHPCQGQFQGPSPHLSSLRADAAASNHPRPQQPRCRTPRATPHLSLAGTGAAHHRATFPRTRFARQSPHARQGLVRETNWPSASMLGT